MKKTFILVGIIALLIIGVSIFYGRNSSLPAQPAMLDNSSTMPPGTDLTQTTPAPTTVPIPNTAVDTSVTVQVGATKEFTVVGQNFSFAPSILNVNVGDKVKIIFKNTDGFHDFHIDEFNVATPRISAGQQAVVEFTADKAGSYEFYCSVGNHRAMGMKGTLMVN